jgi:hypothetical protein
MDDSEEEGPSGTICLASSDEWAFWWPREGWQGEFGAPRKRTSDDAFSGDDISDTTSSPVKNPATVEMEEDAREDADATGQAARQLNFGGVDAGNITVGAGSATVNIEEVNSVGGLGVGVPPPPPAYTAPRDKKRPKKVSEKDSTGVEGTIVVATEVASEEDR